MHNTTTVLDFFWGWGSRRGRKPGLSGSGFLSTDNGSAQEFRITDTSERAERLTNLLMLSYEPMLAWNLDGSIEFWNAGAERLYGFAPNEAVGRISHALVTNQIPDRIYRAAFKASQ